MGKKSAHDPEYELLVPGNGFHGYVAGPLPNGVIGVASAVRFLVQLGAEWGDLSGTRTRTSDIDWAQSTMLPSDHADHEYQAIRRSSFVPTLKRLRKRLPKTLYGEFSENSAADIVSLAFHEAFEAAFRGRKAKRKR